MTIYLIINQRSDGYDVVKAFDTLRQAEGYLSHPAAGASYAILPLTLVEEEDIETEE